MGKKENKLILTHSTGTGHFQIFTSLLITKEVSK